MIVRSKEAKEAKQARLARQACQLVGAFVALLALAATAHASNYALEEIPQTIPAADAAKLKAQGIGTTFQLLERAGDSKARKELAKAARVPEKHARHLGADGRCHARQGRGARCHTAPGRVRRAHGRAAEKPRRHQAQRRDHESEFEACT